MINFNNINVQLLKDYIPLVSDSLSVEEIKKGFSSDRKFVIHRQNEKLLLRVAKLVECNSKNEEYTVLQSLAQLNVKASRPIEIGQIENLDTCYMILTYLDGDDAKYELPLYTEEEQYKIGIEAGKELVKMHQLSAPLDIAPWHDRKLKKYRRYMREYSEVGVKIKNDKKLIDFIEENIHLMKNRPNVFLHDDYHVGNLIVKDKQFIGVIDFNRYDWGDPVHEFLKTSMFSKEVSIPFSIGQIKGYHNNYQPTDLFWRLYSLYLAMSIVSSVVWTIKVIPDTLEEMLDRLYMLLEDHKYFEHTIPSWFSDNYFL